MTLPLGSYGRGGGKSWAVGKNQERGEPGAGTCGGRDGGTLLGAGRTGRADRDGEGGGGERGGGGREGGEGGGGRGGGGGGGEGGGARA